MTTGGTEDRYFEWLYSLVGAVSNRNPARSYWKLFQRLHSTEFVWSVPNDDNRVEDGKALRFEFLDAVGLDPAEVDNYWLTLGSSMLEMLVALSRHASFEDIEERTHSYWFGRLIDNAGWTTLTDTRLFPIEADRLDEDMERIIYRNYDPDGKGGLFPLKNPKQDQRRVELWYQMSAYLLEEDPI